MFPATPFQRRFVSLLIRGLERCPVLTLAAALFLMGAGTLLAVSLAALLAVFPLSWLLGWF